MNQSYKNFEVIVGDNDTESSDAEKVVREIEHEFKKIKYVRHSKNIGSTDNMMFMLSESVGEYFMWLADDDELGGPNYLSSLVDLLDKNPDVVTAVAPWQLMSNELRGDIQRHRDYMSKYWLLRAIKFIWKADDDFFYGLHRIQPLKMARVGSYWSCNKYVASNLTYTFLIDLVISGKIMRSQSKDVCWKCHAYTSKFHTLENGGRSININYIIRRINVHWIYLTRVFERGGVTSIIIPFFVSCLSLAGEFFNILITYIKVRL